MAKDKTTTVLAPITTPALQLLEQVKQERTNLKHVTDRVYKTTLRFDAFDFTGKVTIEQLLTGLSVVLAKEYWYNQAQLLILEPGQEAALFKLSGFTKDELVHDIKLKIVMMQNEDKLKELKELEEAATELMGKEEKAALLQQKLNKFRGQA